MKKALYLLPRIVIVLFSALPFISATIDSFRFGFYLVPYLMFVFLSFVSGIITWFCWSRPKAGGIFFTVLGIFIIVMASKTDIGVDWLAVITGGIPLTLVGILFAYEGFGKAIKFSFN